MINFNFVFFVNKGSLSEMKKREREIFLSQIRIHAKAACELSFFLWKRK
jgi:hypothetical protein